MLNQIKLLSKLTEEGFSRIAVKRKCDQDPTAEYDWSKVQKDKYGEAMRLRHTNEGIVTYLE